MCYQIILISRISLVGLGYFIVVIIAMHKLRPDYNIRSRYISEYAVGKYGKLAASGFVIYGLTILGIYFCLYNILRYKVPEIGLSLLVLWGVAVAITGFFDVDLKDKPMSLHGTIHTIASDIGVIASAIGLIVLSFNFNASVQPITFVTQMIASVVFILVILLFLGLLGDMILKYYYSVPRILLTLHNLTGIIERLLIGISLIWLLSIIKWINS